MPARVVLCLGLAALFAFARDPKAAKLESKAVALGKQIEESWKRFVLNREEFTDDDVKDLIDGYEEAVDLFHQSLEIEERAGLNGQIVVMARRLAKLRFEEMRRKAARRPKPPPPPKPEPGAKPKPAPKPEPKPEPEPEPEPEREEGEPPWPELEETKKQRSRGIQSLRNFLMNSYFANRKFSSLIIRCTGCNGHRRIPVDRDPKTRRIIFGDCPKCRGTGAFLNVARARRGFWLTMSPLYRTDPRKRAEFDAQLEEWRRHPSKVGEFLKGLSIGSIDYRGLWAVVKYKERGHNVLTKRNFSRTVRRMFIRVGKRWFFYEDETDKDFFSPDAD